MLSNKGATEALLGNKQPASSAKFYQINSDPMADKIAQPTQTTPVNQSQSSSNVTQKKKNNPSKSRKTKAQKHFTFVLKIFNIMLGLLLIAFGGYSYYGNNNRTVKNFELIGYIMPGYIIFSGLIILAIQMHIDFICRNMKFLYNYFGRGFFNIYVGIMPLNLLDDTQGSTQPQIEKVAIYILVSLLIFIGVLYMISKIFCCAKQGTTKKKDRRRNDSSSDSSSYE